MAAETKKDYRNLLMYSIYVRNHTENGTFKEVEEDLERIKRLGTDIIWLLPIHPVGKEKRKGKLGSPYAIQDYRAVNPEYGTMDEFKKLVNAIHSKGMKCIMDVVYNHTSPDSWLVKNHPEWFYKKSDGAFGNKVGEWLDVIDLDFRHQELWGYLIDTLKQWAEIVDGFRCDVAPLIPLEFWLRARKEVGAVRPDCFWLSESVEPLFTLDNRARKMISLSDSEIFQAFDVCYEYDIFESFNLYLEGKIPLEDYVKQINMQEYIYPDNYVKLRYLENHDRPRARFIIPDEQQLRNWTAFIYFQKGMTLIFAGQETGNTFRPSLFDKDVVQWETGYDISDYLARLYDIKKNAVFTDSTYSVSAPGNDVVVAVHKSGKKQMIGIFSMKGKTSLVRVDVPEGTYRNQVDDNMVCVEGGLLTCKGEPIIFEEAGKEET